MKKLLYFLTTALVLPIFMAVLIFSSKAVVPQTDVKDNPQSSTDSGKGLGASEKEADKEKTERVLDENAAECPVIEVPRLEEKSLDLAENGFNVVEFQNNIKTVTEEMLKDERMGMVLALEGEVAIVGDIHGDYLALKAIVDKLTVWLQDKEDRQVLFLGDIFDRGHTTLAFDCLLKFYIANPNKVFILKGNHECDMLHDYIDDMEHEWPMIVCNQEIQEYCDALPYAAMINDKTFASHAGVPTLFDMRGLNGVYLPADKKPESMDFFSEVDLDKEYCKYAILWPVFSENFKKEEAEFNVRNSRTEFGPDILRNFLSSMGLQYFVCGHNHAEEEPSFKQCDIAHVRSGMPDWLREQNKQIFTRVISSLEPLKRNEGWILVVEGNTQPKKLFKIELAKAGKRATESCRVVPPTVDKTEEDSDDIKLFKASVIEKLKSGMFSEDIGSLSQEVFTSHPDLLKWFVKIKLKNDIKSRLRKDMTDEEVVRVSLMMKSIYYDAEMSKWFSDYVKDLLPEFDLNKLDGIL